MRPKTSYVLRRKSTGSSEGDDRSAVGNGGVTGPVDDDSMSGMAMARIIDLIEKENRKYRHLAKRGKQTCTIRRQKTRGQIDGV